MKSEAGHVKQELFDFLRELKGHNDRAWFEAHRSEYEEEVREPLRTFIRDFDPMLEDISPHMVADDRKSGGSMFRIHRDTRFSKDKSPYKTWAAIQFRHEAGKDVHAPGFYLHLEPESVFMGAGCWHPDRDALERIRDAIVEDPDAWFAARDAVLASGFQLAGDSLKRHPRGYPPEHPAVDDLKRKDFIAIRPMSEKEVLDPRFISTFARACGDAAPLMRFLTSALGVRF